MNTDCTSTLSPQAGDLRRTSRSAVRRGRQRASYQRDEAYRILDEALVCHVGCDVPAQGTAELAPVVIPTAYARDGDRLLLHGARGNRMLRTLAEGAAACVTVTLLDGLVLARSAFHTSMNYRSVVMFGRAMPVEDLEGKHRALERIVEHAIPGQSERVRPPSDAELRSTLVVAMPIDEASIKIRTGGPVEEEADLAHASWGGSVPLRMVAGPPEPDVHARATGAPAPPQAWDYRRPGW
jgi:uncharacterized protein